MSEWNECSETCWNTDSSKPYQLRTMSPAQFGGQECVSLAVRQECNINACGSDCEIGEWSECSLTCGGGTQTRLVKKETMDGKQCPANVEAEQPCNVHECDYDCKISAWSKCDRTCDDGTGAGTQTRTLTSPI